MILNFKVDEYISKITNSPMIKDNHKEYYKCKFFPKQTIWKNSNLIVTFVNDLGYKEDVHLGQCQDVLSCIIPPLFLSGSYFNMYISSDTGLTTNTISITLNNHYTSPKKKCNVISQIFQQLDTKIDNLIFKDNQILSYSNGKLIDTIYISVNEDMLREIITTDLHDILDETIEEKLKDYVKTEDIRFENGIIYF